MGRTERFSSCQCPGTLSHLQHMLDLLGSDQGHSGSYTLRQYHHNVFMKEAERSLLQPALLWSNEVLALLHQGSRHSHSCTLTGCSESVADNLSRHLSQNHKQSITRVLRSIFKEWSILKIYLFRPKGSKQLSVFVLKQISVQAL